MITEAGKKMKQRVTLTIEEQTLQKVDRTVNKTDIKNRSHAVEVLLNKAFGENKLSTAVILAGGKHSSKIREKARHLPKPMIRVNNKPILEYNLELLKREGIKNIVISLGYKGDMIKEYFGDGNQQGLNISYIKEQTPLGTGGPLKKLAGKIKNTFLVLNADELKDIDLEDMYLFHKKNKSTATIALTTTQKPDEYGVAVMNGNKIMTFIEKPGHNAPSNLINAGLYIIEPEVLKDIPEGFSLLENDIFPRLADNEKLFGYVFSGQWFDIRTPHKFTQAEQHWEGIK